MRILREIYVQSQDYNQMVDIAQKILQRTQDEERHVKVSFIIHIKYRTISLEIQGLLIILFDLSGEIAIKTMQDLWFSDIPGIPHITNPDETSVSPLNEYSSFPQTYTKRIIGTCEDYDWSDEYLRSCLKKSCLVW